MHGDRVNLREFYGGADKIYLGMAQYHSRGYSIPLQYPFIDQFFGGVAQ